MNETMSAPRWARYAWLVVALLWPVALLNYLDRQMLATMKASMMGDLPTIQSERDWGFILGCFKWTYAFLSPFGGWVADRINRRHVIGVSLLIWSAVTWWTGHVTSYHELVAARAMMGVSEAFYMPAALALIADYHFGTTRSQAVGLHQSGIYIGQILGGYAGFVADDSGFGWRWAFQACGWAGIIYALPLLATLRLTKTERGGQASPESERLKRASETPESLAFVARGLFRNPNFVLLVLYFTLPAIAGWVVRDWMPTILREKFGLGQGHAGVKAIVYVQIASIVGAIVGGALADWWMGRSNRGRIYTSAVGTALFLPALFAVGDAGVLGVAVAGLVVFGLGWGFFDCNNMPILAQIVRPEWRATGYGFMNLASISCGGLGDWIFGALRDQRVPLHLIFGAFSGIALLSVFLVLRIRLRPTGVMNDDSTDS